MSFNEEITKTNYTPVVLFEMDITQDQEFWTTYVAGVWFVNFEVNYPNIDTVYLNGVEEQTISLIGSVLANDIRLNSVNSRTICHDTVNSFFYDSGLNELYVHCPDHNDPAIFNMRLGVAFGYRKFGENATYNNSVYEDRILSIPTISKSKDNLFFKQVKFEGGSVKLINTDGLFDTFADDNDIFGNAARIFVGFEGLVYSEFKKVFSGFVENIKISTSDMTVDVKDQRKNLSRDVPPNVYDIVTFPNINDDNLNATIPLCYGECDNIPVVCINEDEVAPVNYTFQICDMENHAAINAITTVYVEGVIVVPASTDLTNAQFNITLASGDYAPGDEVTADVKGYENTNGNLIENGLDIIADLLLNYYNFTFNNDFFNTAHWDVGRAFDINLFVDEPDQLINIIQNICESVRCTFITEDDGRYAARIFQETDAIVQTLVHQQILAKANIDYTIKELLSGITIGYDIDWNESTYSKLIDNTREETVFNAYKLYKSERYDTLILNATDAQIYADHIMDVLGGIQKTINIRTNFVSINREVGDIIQINMERPEVPQLIQVKAEIVGVSKILDQGVMDMTCRIFDVIGEMVYQQGTYWNTDVNLPIYWNTDVNIPVHWRTTKTIELE